MSRHRLTVVLSQAQGKHPGKRALEESIVAALLMEPGLEVSVIPFLYDLGPDHTGRMFLESVRGDMVVLSWLFPRAAFWILDRDGIRGQFGETLLKPLADEDEESSEGPPPEPKGIGSVEVPDRHIWCIDLRDRNSHEPFVEEIRRIAAESRSRAASRAAVPAPAAGPVVDLGMAFLKPNGAAKAPVAQEQPPAPIFPQEELLKTPGRRWYPVIDYSRCTNCMECIDFCLFGVYNLDSAGRLLVENQDNCKKGCPACSRVCPEHAIMFPDYKSPAIAGAPVGAVGSLKIDLTRLFGGDAKDALSQAVLERDRELVADGRDAVGMTIGVPKRQEGKPAEPKDDLDKLMDALDAEF